MQSSSSPLRKPRSTCLVQAARCPPNGACSVSARPAGNRLSPPGKRCDFSTASSNSKMLALRSTFCPSADAAYSAIAGRHLPPVSEGGNGSVLSPAFTRTWCLLLTAFAG